MSAGEDGIVATRYSTVLDSGGHRGLQNSNLFDKVFFQQEKYVE